MVNNELSAILGKRLIKISKLAVDTGISRSTLTNLYYKKTNSISFDVLDKLCTYFSCSVDDLISHTPNIKKVS